MAEFSEKLVFGIWGLILSVWHAIIYLTYNIHYSMNKMGYSELVQNNPFIKAYYIEFPIRIRGFRYRACCGEVLGTNRHLSKFLGKTSPDGRDHGRSPLRGPITARAVWAHPWN